MDNAKHAEWDVVHPQGEQMVQSFSFRRDIFGVEEGDSDFDFTKAWQGIMDVWRRMRSEECDPCTIVEEKPVSQGE